MPAKRPVEVRQVIESKLEGDCANRTARMEGVFQNTIGSRQTLAEHEFRESRAHAFEQPLDVTWREFQARRHGEQCQVAVAQILADVGLDRGSSWPRGDATIKL